MYALSDLGFSAGLAVAFVFLLGFLFFLAGSESVKAESAFFVVYESVHVLVNILLVKQKYLQIQTDLWLLD
jgi:hypothetical protein